MKDNFSVQSDKYAKYRPTYPEELFEFIVSRVRAKNRAWDCGTGNGQVAYCLADYFGQVMASDISLSQIRNAPQHPKINYSVQPAEKTSFPERFFDLIVVAQAIHWFDFDSFYQEVRRTLAPDGILVVTGYGRVKVSDAVDRVVDKFYHDVVGRYWDKERKYIEENYRTIPFPFAEIKAPEIESTFDWTLEHFTGYLETWSAVKHFIKHEGSNPLDQVIEELKHCWGSGSKKVRFPVLLRVGQLPEAGF